MNPRVTESITEKRKKRKRKERKREKFPTGQQATGFNS
jgi:hypothetical protein